MLTGAYADGTSVLHRLPVPAKLLLLAVFLVPVSLVQEPWMTGSSALVVLAAYLACRIPLRLGWGEVRPLRWFLVVMAPFQAWSGGWQAVVVTCGGMAVGVAAASLVTLTTRASEMLAGVERLARPLRHVGVCPERVALTVSLALRTVPVIGRLLQETLDARRARGLERSVRAVATPLVIRTVRHADRVGDALTARGVDD
ncbi:energy-coupling factor transporter transmembrane component T family protein [Arsenicicoccus dermatophilus]|uniref:energy-coupling factor transporter transmembrane component T family protein n=1 Tax=Arsenicicoccus dermatophilus TaxID=1076331 RepID=UPI0039172447